MKTLTLPVIPLREVVLFPYSMHPILIARPFSLRAARHALSMNSDALFFTQKNSSVEEPSREDLYEIGVTGQFIQYVTPSDGSIRAVVRGVERVRLLDWKPLEAEGYFLATVEPYPQDSSGQHIPELLRILRDYFRQLMEAKPYPLEDIVRNIMNDETDPQVVANILSAHFPLPTPDRQRLLEAKNLEHQLRLLIEFFIRELEFVNLKKKIEERVREEIQRNQRQWFLQQEMKEIQRELGEDEEDEFAVLEQKIREAQMPPDVEKKALSELNKLRKTPAISPEATVLRNYLDWLISLPWSKKTQDNLDIRHARKILDEDHYGLEEQKNRILEYLSVLKLKGRLKGEVICFVGPPGVGKTSLAKSIARALGRRFVRMSLGGVRDEAEIRDHRRTYAGALPGRIIQQIRRAGTKNPVFLLDEIDKMGADFRGDPQAALMEVLDPEINKSFVDHYLEVEFDLSEVLFITTANSLYGIPRPLMDRMEIIPIRGYLDHEKVQIAKRHLIPKKLEETGLPKKAVTFEEKAILTIIREYTRESGVRDLERQIARILRKIAKEYQETGKRVRITPKRVRQYLGLPKQRIHTAKPELPVGVVYGLAWTEYGGEILRIEVVPVRGKGNLELTGQLGEVMKESARAALTFVRAHYQELGLDEDFYSKYDIHLHVPEGAIPKDGPSAGVAILIAMISALTGKPVSGELAMTGEITLSGEVLPVGGLKEKLLAAKRAGIHTVYLPQANEPEIQEMEAEIKEGLTLRFVSRAEDLVRQIFFPTSKAAKKREGQPQLSPQAWIAP